MKNAEQEYTVNQLEAAIDAARMCGAGCFSLQDVISRLPGGKTGAALENRILRMLDADEALFRDGEETFAGRAEFFTGKTFLVTPDVFEIRQGILIPGHRTAAFVSPEVFPSEVEWAEAGKAPVPVKEFSAALDMIYNYYLLLGSEQLLDYLVADHPDNAELAGDGADGKATICVYDMAEFYKAHDFQNGDALVCEVEDWLNGKIRFRYLAAADRESGRDWSNAFADALEDVIRQFEHYFDIPEQLAWAFFTGRDTLFQKPEKMLSCDEFIRTTDRIEISYQEDHTVLASCADEFDSNDGFDHDEDCSCGDEHHHHHHRSDLPEEVRISKGETEDFARMLRELGSLLTPVEVDSFILDSCSFRSPDYDDFFRRCFGGTDLVFADDAQEAVFHNMLEERWETFTANYDRENDLVKAELRGQILEILDAKMEFLNNVEDPEALPQAEMRRLAEISIYLDEFLRLLNSPKHELPEEEAEEMAEKIADLADTQNILIEKLQS